MTGGSLSTRLVLYWAAALSFAFFTLPATVYLPLAALRVGEPTNAGLESWTTKRARNIVVDALHMDADGAKRVDSTPELRAQLARNPGFIFAVRDVESGALLPGSSVRLADYFNDDRRVERYGSIFHLVDDPNPNARGYERTMETPVGRMRVIVYGADFHWDDVLLQLYNHLTFTNLSAFLPLCAAMAIVGSFVVGRCLSPLRSAAKMVAAIDVNSLDRRVAREELPSELRPFVDAVNGAFDRVRDGVARQRRFTANAAHELRTPIAILKSRVQKLADKPLKHDIERDVRRIQTIVDQLLILARLGERERKHGEHVVDLGRIALAITADYMPIAIDHRRAVAFEGPSEPVRARVDASTVESIVANLIENAVRAEPEGGAVLVRVSPDRVIEVVDHGDGVDPGDRERIFEPFWRKNEDTPGAGLGLAIVRELLDALGGSIEARQTQGGGATFVVRLPAA